MPGSLSPDQLATLLILGSAVLHASVSVLWKADRDAWAFRVLVDGSGALALAPCLAFVPVPQPRVWLMMGASITVHYLYVTLVNASYRLGDLSAVYPVARGSAPLMTATGAWLVLGEALDPFAMAGIALLVGGIVAFALEGRGRRGHDPRQARAFLLALATGGTIATYTLIDTTGVRATESALGYIAWFFVVNGTVVTALVAARRGRSLAPALARGWKPGLVAGLVFLASYGLALAALRLGATAEVAALRETSVVFAAILGAAVLKEGFGRRRLAAAAVVAAGAVVMHLG